MPNHPVSPKGVLQRLKARSSHPRATVQGAPIQGAAIYKYTKNYYCKKTKKIFFLQHIKKLFFVETYTNGKPDNTRTKVNCRKKGYKKLQKHVKRKVIKHSWWISIILKIYHKIDLSKLQKCRIFHKMNLSKSQKCGIYHKMN